MGFNLQLGDALRSESVTAIDDAIRAIARQEIDRTPRTKFCDACAYMHQPEISARCCCVACHGDDVPAWAQRMNTPPSIEKTGESASSGSASGRIPVLNADSPASPVKPCPFGPVEASVERFLRAIEARLDVDDDDAHILSRDGLELLKIAWSNRRTPAPSPAYTEPTAKECLAVYAEALTKADVPGSIPSERHRAGIEAVLAFCLNRAPDAEYLKSYADAVLASRAPSPSPALSAISFEEVERAYDDAKESDGRSWSREAGLRAVMALYAKPAPALAAQLIEAAKRIDWVQIGLNGDGCFHLEDGRFCLRGHRWPGHGGRNPVHLYEPLYVAMTRIAKASDAAPALAALVEAGDAMRAYFDETTLTMNRIRDKEAPGLMWALTEEYVDGAAPLLAAYDAARAEHERSAEK